MLRDVDEPVEMPPCCVCAAPAEAPFWESHLCHACFVLWRSDNTATQPLEMAHAKAHPDDVLHLGTTITGEPWVALKAEAYGRLCRDFARAWVLKQRKAVASAMINTEVAHAS